MSERPLEEIVRDIVSTITDNDQIRPSRYFYYVEFDTLMSAPTLLREDGGKLTYLRDRSISELEFELNQIASPQPVGALLLDIEGDAFKASLEYDVKIDRNTDARLAVAVKERFGDKPIIYPNLPGPREEN